jgi:hypothetical protein
MPEPILAFDRAVLDAYLATRGARYQPDAICRQLRMRVTPATLARVLRSLQRLEAAARALHQEQPT